MGDGDNLQVSELPVFLERGVDLGECELVHETAKLHEVRLGEAVESIVDCVAETFARGRGIVQHVFFEELAALLELLGGHAVVDQVIDFAERGAQGEVAGLVGYRPDPEFEELAAARDVLRRGHAGAAVGVGFDVGVVAVVEAALLADDLVEPAAGVAVFAEPRVGDGEGIPFARAAHDAEGEADADRGRGRWLFHQGDAEAGECRR